jgi:polysaccharide export outer membrane protein
MLSSSPRRPAATVAAIAVVLCSLCGTAGVAHARTQRTANDYVVGPQDVLTITCYDQADLSGQFTVQADGTFNFALIGRVIAGGLTLRAVEASIKKQLTDGGFFKNPQIAVAVEQYKSQRIFIVGEVRSPGTYTLSGDMTLVEALARAGSTLPTSSGEAVIVRAPEGRSAAGPVLPGDDEAANIVRINLSDLEDGFFARNTALRDGDTIFVPRAQSIYVFGQVKAPGAYPMQQKHTTVLQALSLAGGLTDRAASGRIRIVRIVNGVRKEMKIELSDVVQPGDTLVIPERFF